MNMNRACIPYLSEQESPGPVRTDQWARTFVSAAAGAYGTTKFENLSSHVKQNLIFGERRGRPARADRWPARAHSLVRRCALRHHNTCTLFVQCFQTEFFGDHRGWRSRCSAANKTDLQAVEQQGFSCFDTAVSVYACALLCAGNVR